MSYENKTNEELIELLEERDQSVSDLQEEISDSESDSRDYDAAILKLSTIAESSFYAGIESSRNITLTPIKAWLNYKIGERL